jgi:hypothetical protein
LALPFYAVQRLANGNRLVRSPMGDPILPDNGLERPLMKLAGTDNIVSWWAFGVCSYPAGAR